MQFKSINPSSEKVIYSFDSEKTSSITEKINASNRAQKKWKETDFKEKKEFLSSLKAILLKNIKKFSQIITLEMGKPIKQSISELNTVFKN